MLSNFQKGVKILHNTTDGLTQVFHEAQKDLFRIVNKGRILIEECCSENWVDATVIQLNNKEWFRELLSDFKSCFHTLCDISCDYNPDEKVRKIIFAIKKDTTFYPTPTNEVEKDQISICGRLSKHLNTCNTKDCKDCSLARYLEQYLRVYNASKVVNWIIFFFPYDYPPPEYGDHPQKLGESNGVVVYSPPSINVTRISVNPL